MKRGILLSALVIVLLTSLAVIGCGAPTPTTPITPTTPTTPTQSTTPTAPAKVIRLKFNESRPPTSSYIRTFVEPWSKLIERESGGRVDIDIYLAETLVKSGDSYDAVLTGITEITHNPSGRHPGRFPLSEMTVLPFLFESSLTCGLSMQDALDSGYFGDEFRKEVKGIGFSPNGAAEIVSRTRYVKTLEDWKGLRVQAGVGAVQVEMLKLLGAVYLGITSPEMYEALQRGLQDVSVREWEGQSTWRVYEVAKYRTGGARMNLSSPQGIYLMNLTTYNSLPSDIRAVIDKYSGKWATEVITANFDRENQWRYQQILEFDKQAGNPPVYSLPAEERNKWREVLKPMEENYITNLEKTKGLGAKGTETLAKLKEFSKKYAEMYPPGSDAEYEMWKKYGYEAVYPGYPKDFIMPAK